MFSTDNLQKNELHDHLKQHFSQVLKQLLKENKMTNTSLAKRLKITPQSMCKITKGACLPSILHLIIIADSLNVSIDYLLGRNKEFDYKRIFTLRINYLLGQKNLSCYDLAKEVSINIEEIKQIVCGTNFPNMSKLLILSNFFNVSIDYLLGKTEA